MLSGYLITGLLIAEIRSTGRVDFLRFYARRARRLLPAAITVVIATLLIGRIVYAPVDHRNLANTGFATSLYFSNLYFVRTATDYLADPGGNPLLHTWSLAVEEQFYLFWPTLVLLGFSGFRAKPRQARLVATMVGIGVASYGLCIWLTGVSQPWAFFMLPTRAWEFAVGAIACMAPAASTLDSWRVRAIAWIGFLAVLGAGIRFGSTTVFPGVIAMIPVGGTALLLSAGAINGSAGPFRLLVNRPMMWFGRISYSWYLWHWPVLIFAQAFPSLMGVGPAIALSVLSLGLAALTYTVIENPIRSSATLRPRPALSLAMAAVLTLAGAGVSAVTRFIGAREAVRPGQMLYSRALDLPLIYSDGCHLPPAATEMQRCVYGDTSARSSIVLFGDSHAAQWFPALQRIARERHLELLSLTKSGCPSAFVELENEQLGRKYTECTTWRDAAMQRIIELRPEVVVLSNWSGYLDVPGPRVRWTTNAEAWQSGMEHTVRTLGAAGLRIVLLADTPLPGFDVVSCLARHAWNPTLHRDPCEFPRASATSELAHRIDGEVAALVPSAQVVDLTDIICPARICRPQIGRSVLFRDDHHLTTRFAASLADTLARRILSAR